MGHRQTGKCEGKVAQTRGIGIRVYSTLGRFLPAPLRDCLHVQRANSSLQTYEEKDVENIGTDVQWEVCELQMRALTQTTPKTECRLLSPLLRLQKVCGQPAAPIFSVLDLSLSISIPKPSLGHTPEG